MKSSLLKNIIISVFVMYFVGSMFVSIEHYIYATEDLSNLNNDTEENVEMVNITEVKKVEYETTKEEIKSIQIGGIFSAVIGVIMGILVELYNQNKDVINAKKKLILGVIVSGVLIEILEMGLITFNITNETVANGFFTKAVILTLGVTILFYVAFIICIRLTSEGKKNELNEQLRKMRSK